jgi:hypothetical protein
MNATSSTEDTSSSIDEKRQSFVIYYIIIIISVFIVLVLSKCGIFVPPFVAQSFQKPPQLHVQRLDATFYAVFQPKLVGMNS